METKKTSFWQELFKLVTNKNILLVLLMTSLNASAQFMAKTPVNVYGQSLGISMTVLGFITTAMGIGKLICRPIAGHGADKFPVKKWLAFTVLIRVITYVVYAMTQSLAGFTIARLLEGASFALLGTAMYTITCQCASKKMLGTAIALYATIPKLFLMFMPTLSMILYEGKGAAVPFWFAAGFVALIWVLSLFLDVNPAEAPAPAPEVKKEKKKFALSSFFAKEGFIFAPMCWANSAIVAAEDLIVVVYATALGYPVAGGLYFSLKNTLSLILNVPMGVLADRSRLLQKLICSFGFISKAVAFFLLAFFPSAIMFSIAGAIVGLGMPLQNIMQAEAVKIMPKSKAGVANSTHLLLTDIGVMVLSPLCGGLVEGLSYQSTFLIFGILGAAGGVLFFILDKTINKMIDKSAAIDAGEAS